MFWKHLEWIGKHLGSIWRHLGGTCKHLGSMGYPQGDRQAENTGPGVVMVWSLGHNNKLIAEM